ncbi:hypothetical protein MKZ38_001581 [Zalerion maritima]|uniref:Copper acquisition factor BIM1-like domain-containing protein n=1 Tax=Zalerion maritima TaxID=339359 RepID=A0AAD5WLS3_9PEZI|nr:hypothetical protein MKZ38_001581 [Zalerion maritima]
MQLSALVLLTGASLTAAHYSLDYPEWRVDSLGSEDEAISQWNYPCAGAAPNSGNRTDWPLTGGSLTLGLHHPWTYVFVNLGMGSNVSSFNVSLTDPFWNATGNGTLCAQKMTLPPHLEVSDGDEASIQVVTLGETGNALYNCADIRFSADAAVLEEGDGEGMCKSVNVTVGEVAGAAAAANGTDAGGDGDGASAAAAGLSVNALATAGSAVLAMVAVGCGVGL